MKYGLRRAAAGCSAVVLAVGLSVVTVPAKGETPDQPKTMASWMAAVYEHVPGRRDAALRRVALWSAADVLTAAGQAPSRRQSPEAWAVLLRRGLLLHMDTALLTRTAQGYEGGAVGAGTTFVADGRAVGEMSGTAQWDICDGLIAMIPDPAERLELRREWFRTATAVLQMWGELPELQRQLETAGRLVGDDPVLLLHAGTLHQTYAGAVIQQYVAAGRRLAAARRQREPALSALPASAGRERSIAAGLFRRALALDPSLSEARVRLAHVLGDDGRHQEAVTEVMAALAVPVPPFLDYYGSLVLGREARTTGDAVAAERALARAAAIRPAAQSPGIGLSQLALTAGDRAAAAGYVLAALSAGSREDHDDPWWWSFRAHEPGADDRLAAMRRRLQR